MRKTVVVAATLVMMCFMANRAAAEVQIKDINPGHWAYKSVQYLVENGYLALYDDGKFRGGNPVSREVFATALYKLIEQIQSGEISVGAGDVREIKKLLDEFKNEISDYESRMKAFDERLEDIEKNQTVIQQDISKSMVEFRDGYKKMTEENEKLRTQVGALSDEVTSLDVELQEEKKARKRTQMLMLVGVVAAIAVGASD